MPELPTGTITFLFSDIEGSTRLLEALGDGYVALLREHNRIFREAIREYEGTEVSTEGDSFFVVFRNPLHAIEAATRIQQKLTNWTSPARVHVRIGLHTGFGQLSGGDYVGIDVHRAARIAAAGHGGQILLSDATRALVGSQLPANLSLVDLGPHRLKDLAHPERLFQLAVEGLRSKFPPLRSLDARPNNLPAQLTRFIGRQDQVAELKRRLLNGARLLTLTGPGGTGKTRLAIEVAGQMLPAFEDGTWFVELSSVRDPTLVVAAIAEVLGVTAEAEQPLQEALASSLKEKAMLVVLDNFEQVVAAGADVEQLLQAAPRLKVLVTSRTVLRRYGEQEFPVSPFALPDPKSVFELAGLAQYEAISLFVERAAAVKPDFALTPANAPSVAEITIRLDGLPLAIELAASRVKILSPQAILERLGRDFAVLVSRVPDTPARQRTLRGAIEWSYQLLTAAERLLFRQLSVFQAGATVEAIESICTTDPGRETLDDLASLVDNSLLRQVESTDGTDRFVMLETIRAYAAEQLKDQPELSAATQRAHATYFADFARQQSQELTGQQREFALTAIAADISNVRASWRYWVAAHDLAQLNKLIDTLWLFYDARGWYHAEVQVVRDLLEVLSSTPSNPERALQELMLRTSLARALMAIHGYTQEVEDAYNRALAVMEGQRQIPQLFPVLRGLASFYTLRGELEKVVQVGGQILELAQAQGDRNMEVDAHLLLGMPLAMRGDLHGGLEQVEKAIACFESTGYKFGTFRLGIHPAVTSLIVSALNLWALGFPDRAAERQKRAFSLAMDFGHSLTLAYALFHSGLLRLWSRDLETAQGLAVRLLQVADEGELQIWNALGKFLLGVAKTGLGAPEDGLKQIRDGLQLYQRLNTPPIFWPLLLYFQAGAYAQAGRPADGLPMIDEAIETGGTDFVLIPEFYVLKGELLFTVSNGSDASAESWLRRGVDTAKGLDARMLQLRAATRLSHRWLAQGKAAEASQLLRAIYETFTEGFATADLREASDLLSSLP
ncbi:MAG TPA: adenylate/guanylate cyclase domain-containing protein [Propionibacteriaceae bacterium]|nr:adenylate/guanylate cyclase domain-containing protein [Propionibacteriaceae bacterium]